MVQSPRASRQGSRALRSSGVGISGAGEGDARSQTMDGKSIMGILLLAAATGTRVDGSADGGDEQARSTRSASSSKAASARTRAAPKGIGVSPGVGAGRAVVLIQRAQVLRFSIPAAHTPQRNCAPRRGAGGGRRINSIAFRSNCWEPILGRCSMRSGSCWMIRCWYRARRPSSASSE